MLDRCMIKLICAKYWAQAQVKSFFKDEEGEVNIIAIIVILAIAIALAIVFRNQIKGLFDSIWSSINSSKDDATKKY